MDPGEDPADTARREALEETGDTVELDELIGVDSTIVSAEARFSDTDRALQPFASSTPPT